MCNSTILFLPAKVFHLRLIILAVVTLNRSQLASVTPSSTPLLCVSLKHFVFPDHVRSSCCPCPGQADSTSSLVDLLCVLSQLQPSSLFCSLLPCRHSVISFYLSLCSLFAFHARGNDFFFASIGRIEVFLKNIFCVRFPSTSA
jgi:hypothetical protein